MWTVALHVSGLLALLNMCQKVVATPGILGAGDLCHSFQRDINLSFLRRITMPGKMFCRRGPPGSSGMAKVEAFKYAINMINDRSDILPNVTLGFVIQNACGKDLAALAEALYVLPDKNDPNIAQDGVLDNCREGRRRFRITGVVGPGTSREGVMVGGLFSIFQIPTIMTSASSDELSDKTRFSYVMRMVPPDRFQADAILDLLLKFGWTYASLLYMEGSYGENGAKQIEKRTKSRGICIAYSHMMSSDELDEDAKEVARQVIRHKKARVIIAFTNAKYLTRVFRRIEEAGYAGYFIWVGSDAFSAISTERITNGAFQMGFGRAEDEKFAKYYEGLTPVNTPDNPWIRDYWQALYKCSWDNSPGARSCKPFENDTELVAYPQLRRMPTEIDAVFTFAYALHELIDRTCPQAFTNKSYLPDCVTGPRLLPLLLNTTFKGTGGRVQFDKNGDFVGWYVIKQSVHDAVGSSSVGMWDKQTESITINADAFKWHMFNNRTCSTQSGLCVIPESVCSKPCKKKEYFIQKELPCCWECRKCRENEILVDNKTACRPCRHFTWPDEASATECQHIEPEIMAWSSSSSITLASFATLCLCCCTITVGVFFVNRTSRLIKATSRHLMSIIMVGIFIGCATVFFLLARPTRFTCVISRFGLNLAVTLIYAPLMVKSIRIYRIFNAGMKGTKTPRLIGTRVQLLGVGIILFLEVTLSTGVSMFQLLFECLMVFEWLICECLNVWCIIHVLAVMMASVADTALNHHSLTHSKYYFVPSKYYFVSSKYYCNRTQ